MNLATGEPFIRNCFPFKSHTHINLAVAELSLSIAHLVKANNKAESECFFVEKCAKYYFLIVEISPWKSPHGLLSFFGTPGSKCPLEFAIIKVLPDLSWGLLQENFGTSQFLNDLDKKVDSYWFAVKFLDIMK